MTVDAPALIHLRAVIRDKPVPQALCGTPIQTLTKLTVDPNWATCEACHAKLVCSQCDPLTCPHREPEAAQ